MPRKVIDVHGHIVAPSELYSYREFLIGTRGHYGRRLKGFSEAREGMSHGRTGVIPPEELEHFAREHISWLDHVGTDVQLVSARPYSLMHSEKPARIVHWWAQTVNDAIATQSAFFPDRLQGMANLPLAWNAPIEDCFDELDRCMNDLGFVGVLLNPDPSEGRAPQEVPGLGDEYWYPLYEKLVEYEAPLLVHSAGCVSLRENQSLHFISEESVAVMSLVQSEAFEVFPDLKVVVPHGGGAIPYQLGRFRGTYWEGTGRTGTFDEAVRKCYYDTSLYTEEALDLLVKAIGADRIVLGTERPGDGSHKKTTTEGWADDIAAVLRGLPGAEEKGLDQMLGDTALDIFPRLRKNLEAAGSL
ncbi:amidohydrolase family protein [Rhodococcus sp. T2V]|uniref:amidohydrolase family protein n=1 Tax=Rhodococcus sp. T2V TaxID=3034164 RepID=UPI0023E341FF|nr:amidohydrolase family protein [Rhodococcus sp. T2V]MDF3307965.1 amidohydrolase family protein [Rhodococcus sp. T2V]